MPGGFSSCKDVLLNDNLYPGLNISGVIDPIIGPNISAAHTTQPIIEGRRSFAAAARADLRAGLPVAAARRVEPRFEERSENNSLVIANIGDSVALHCNIWMKQVNSLQNSKKVKFGTDWSLSIANIKLDYTHFCFIINLIRDPIIITILRVSALSSDMFSLHNISDYKINFSPQKLVFVNVCSLSKYLI